MIYNLCLYLLAKWHECTYCVCVFDSCKHILYIYMCVHICLAHAFLHCPQHFFQSGSLHPKLEYTPAQVASILHSPKRKTEGRKPSPFPPHTKPSQPTWSPNSSVAGHRLQWNRFGSRCRHGDVDLAPCLDVVGEKDSSLSILASQWSLNFCMSGVLSSQKHMARWSLQIFWIFIPVWGTDPIWLRFFQMGWNRRHVERCSSSQILDTKWHKKWVKQTIRIFQLAQLGKMGQKEKV